MAGRFKVETVFKAVDQMTAPVNRMQRGLGKFSKSIERGLRRVDYRVNKVGAALKKTAIIAGVAGAAIVAAGADVARTGMQFEQSITNASAKFGVAARRGTEQFELLTTAVRDVGRTTEFTASQAASALDFLAMAGLSASASVAALPEVVDLATAAQTDLATATDIATDSLGAFGLATKDPVQLSKNLSKVSDLLAKTSTSTNTAIVELFESIKAGAPSAMQAGASIETFAAAVGIMANAGKKGESSGTALRNMFLRLASPAASAKKLLRDLKIEVADSSGNMRDMFEIIGDLARATQNMGNVQKSAMMDTIFGKKAISAATIVMQAGEDQLKAYRAQLENAQGASKDMAEYMRGTTLGSFKALKSSIESVKITLFEMEKGPLKATIDRMTEWTRANEQLIATKVSVFIDKVTKGLQVMASHRVAIMRTVGAIAGLVIGLKVLIGVLTIVNILMTSTTTGLIITGVVLLIAAIAALTIAIIKNWDTIKDFFAGLWENIINATSAAMIKLSDFFVGLWASIKSGAMTAASVLVNVLLSPIERILGLMAKLPGKVGKLAQSGLEFIDSSKAQLFSENEAERPATKVVSPQERVARSIEERRNTSTSEVTIRDDTGRAEVTAGKLGNGLILLPSGGL